MSEEEHIILPERFKQVEYIESTGTQYINTNYIPNAETGFCVDAQNITGGDQTPMGSGPRNANSIDCLRVPITTGNSVGAQWGSWQSWANNATLAGKRFIGKTNFLNDLTLSYYINEELNASKALPAFTGTPTVPVYVFGTSNANNNGVTYAWRGRIYDAKISQGAEVIKHFIPVYDTHRGIYCMYEHIEGKAYYNNGTGALKGPIMDDVLHGVTNKLPDGFKRIDYLMNAGLGAYIDTHYVPTNETGYYIEAQSYKNDSSYVFGSSETTNWGDNKRIYFMLGNSTNWGWMTYGTLNNAAANLRHPTYCDFNFLNSRKVVATINNTDFAYNLSDLSFTPTRSIYLFALNQGGSLYTSGYHAGTLSRFKISEGTEIVRDFIPCLDAEGWPCMYELMEGKAYYNDGVGSFSYPRNYKENTPYELPAGYKKCVYLQSNGTQWINTEHIPDEETGVYLRAQHLNQGDFVPFGSWESSSAYYYAPRFNTSNKSGIWSFGTTYQMLFYYDKGDDLIYTSTMNLYNDRTVNFWSEDTDYHGYITFAPKTMTRPLWLFSFNMDNTTINETYAKFGGRIFRAKITQGSFLIHDFVPCLDTDNRPCMYDLVTQEPYYNQGSGDEFEYCLEHQLPSDFIKLKYLESTGTQIIKTGIVPTDSTGIYVDAYHTKYNGDTDWSVIGLRNTNGNTYFTVGRVQRDTNGAGFGWGAFTTPGGTGNVRYEASLNFLNDRQSIITAPSFAQRINALGTLSFTPTKDLYMFGMNNYDGAATLYSTYRIYRAKISEGSEIVRDWVPAMDNRNSRPCMYDLINNVAYYNDGTGDFDYNKDFEGTYTGYGVTGCIGNRLGSVNKNFFPSLIYTKFEDMDEETKVLFRSAFSIKNNVFYDGTGEIIGSFNTQGLLTGSNLGPDHNVTDGKGMDSLLSPHNYSTGIVNSRDIQIISFESNLESLENGNLMFSGCKTLTKFNANLDSLKYGYNMFNSCSFTSFPNDLPSLIDGHNMFSGCDITFFNGNLKSLENGEGMFDGTDALISFNSDLPQLTNANSMFDNSGINEFKGRLDSLTNGDYMFSYCFNLHSFTSNLNNLSSGYYMFDNCNLDAESVENILTTIPTYNDGQSHKLTMTIQRGAAVEKFNEISGAEIPDTGSYMKPSTVSYKGWTIEVTTGQLK